MVLAKPGMQFGDVWKDLERHFAIDDPHHWRAMWDRVELQHQGEVIRLKEWLFFQAEFEAAKSQVSDCCGMYTVVTLWCIQHFHYTPTTNVEHN